MNFFFDDTENERSGSYVSEEEEKRSRMKKMRRRVRGRAKGKKKPCCLNPIGQGRKNRGTF